MSVLAALGDHWFVVLIWGLVASAAMATLLEGVQLLGFSRMSLPFLFGAFLSQSRRKAIVLGYGLYLAGGWAFAFVYAMLFESVHFAGWWFGLLVGVAHGLFLIAVFLPLLPFVHPRLATDYDGPDAISRLEPPGRFGLNYGRATPATTVLAQALYGLIFGLGYQAATGGFGAGFAHG